MNAFIKNTIIVVLLLVGTTTYAEDRKDRKLAIPAPIGVSYLDPQIEDMNWYWGQSGDVEVICVNEKMGLDVEKSVSKNKNLLSRWGIKDTKFTVPVRMMVVPSEDMMKKLFRITKTKVEPFRNYNGQVMHVVYLLAKDQDASINEAFTQLFMAEHERQANYKFNWWAYRGMSLLNSSPEVSRTHIKSFSPQSSFSVEDILVSTKEQWSGMSQQDQEKFDSQSIMLCLLLRKHFGQNPLHKFWNSGSDEEALKAVYGFVNYNHLDQTYQRYLRDVVKDVNEIPMSYLTIRGVK